MGYLAQVTDLCGRVAPFVANISCALKLSYADIEFILDEWADGKSACIGEFEYREVDDRTVTESGDAN